MSKHSDNERRVREFKGTPALPPSADLKVERKPQLASEAVTSEAALDAHDIALGPGANAGGPRSPASAGSSMRWGWMA
jgi:hypothetical protein